MQLAIDSSSGTPIYLQIVNQVKYVVAAGRLAPGEELPPIRTLAEQLLINPNTVARAYLELQRAGVVVKRHGAGTFVADHPPSVSKSQRQKVLGERADVLLSEARQLGVSFEEVIELLQTRQEKMDRAPV